jgi:uncharacterized membrane protein
VKKTALGISRRSTATADDSAGAPAIAQSRARHRRHNPHRLELHKMRLSRTILGLFTVLLGLLSPAAVLGQTPVGLSTPFPSLIVDPGGSATFAVAVTSDVPQRVDLSVISTPDGWQTRLSGGGYTIAAVETNSDSAEPASVTLEVSVPADAGPGSYQVVLEGRGPSGSDQLTVDVDVQALEPGSVSFDTQYPVLRGAATTSFAADLTLTNGTNQPITFSLEAEGPEGWRAAAQPSGETQAATTSIDAGSSATIHVTASAPGGTTAGTYAVTVRALGGPEPVEAQLSIEVTGSYNVELSTPDGRLNAEVSASGTTILPIVVTNTGDAPLTDITVSATPPSGWTVDFDTPTIAELAAGEPLTVNATIKPADNAIAGDYIITFRARSADASAMVDVRTAVQTSALGGLLGLGILALVAIGLLIVFRRYGRR